MGPSFNAGVLIENDVFFSDTTINALMKLNIENGECKFLDCFPEEGLDTKLLHRDCFRFEDELVFCPDQGNHIHVFNLKDNSLSCYPIFKSKQSRYNFSRSLKDGDYLWIFPGNLVQPIILFDVKRKEYSSFDSIESIVGEDMIFSMSRTGAAVENIAKRENNVYIALKGTNQIIRFELETRKMDMIESRVSHIYSLYSDRDELWGGADNELIKFNDFKKKETRIRIEGTIASDCPFVMFSDEKDSFMVSAYGGYIHFYEPEEDAFKIIETASLAPALRCSRGYLYENYMVRNNEVIFFPPYGKKIQFFNVNNKEIRTKDVKIDRDDEYIRLRQACLLTSDGTVQDESVFGLNELLEAVIVRN